MIEFNINTSPDVEMLGSHRLFKNFIKIGKNNGDLLINDPGIVDGHLYLEIVEIDGDRNGGVIVNKGESVDHYFVNGKITNGMKRVKSGDQISFADTTIMVKDFCYTPVVSKKDNIRKNLELIANDSHFLGFQEMLEFLEEDLKKISHS
ncbi:MAG: hypothetical protein HQK53_19375 [Oligoflexia bacterium]|nr:hypothetical protein [Oligoflexia bacterium]